MIKESATRFVRQVWRWIHPDYLYIGQYFYLRRLNRERIWNRYNLEILAGLGSYSACVLASIFLGVFSPLPGKETVLVGMTVGIFTAWLISMWTIARTTPK